MLNERIEQLLEYLNVLSQVQGSGHYVNEEIKEVVKEIRIELGLEKRKVDTLKESRRLVFEAKLGKNVSFRQMQIFEATFGYSEGTYFIPFYQEEEEAEATKAINVLNDMKAQVKFEFGFRVLSVTHL